MYNPDKTHRYVYVLLCIIFVWLSANVHAVYVPNSDFLNYLSTGYRMLKNPLDPLITSAPLYPVIVSILEHILPIKQPGVIGGIWLNIVCFILMLYGVWLIARRWLKGYSLLPIVFLGVNHAVMYVVLQPSNIPLAVTLIVFSIYFYKTRPIVAYIFILFAVLTRIESVVMLLIYIVSDSIFFKKVRCSLPLFLIFLGVIAWYMRPVVPHDNYMDEMIYRNKEIPNIAFIRNSFIRAPFSMDLLLSHKIMNIYSFESFLMLASLGIFFLGVRLYFRTDPKIAFILVGYVIGYAAIHIIFPDRVIRYSYPLLPFIYIVLCWPVIFILGNAKPIFRLFSITYICILTICIVGLALLHGPPYLEDQKYDRAERRLVSEWLNTHVTIPTTVYTFEHYVFAYYIENSLVYIKDATHRPAWEQDLCTDTNEIYIVFDNQTDGPGEYFDHLNGIEFFLRLHSVKGAMSNMKLIKRIQIQRRHAEIYTFIQKPDISWCKAMFHE